MDSSVDRTTPSGAVNAKRPHGTVFPVLGAVGFVHMLNDMMQSVIVALYPMLKGGFDLGFFQIGMITFTFQLTASLLQPMVGSITDKHPLPFSLPVGMCFTLGGVLLLSVAPTYPLILLSVALIGCGSSVFHPESARVARMASGGRYSFAQSAFQVGGNLGQALGPSLVAAIVLTTGRRHVAWFGVFAVVAIIVLSLVSRWYRAHIDERVHKHVPTDRPLYPKPLVRRTVGILFVLMFSKFFYLSSITSYYTFFLIDRFGTSAATADHLLSVFLLALAIGTLIGGRLGDRIGRKQVIWFSILGCTPFTLALPYVGFPATIGLSVAIGVILASAFPAIVVYAQDMLAHRIGMVSGLFYGFSFGLGGIGAAVVGLIAHAHGIEFAYRIWAFLPLLGLLAVFLPDVRPPEEQVPAATAPSTHGQRGR